jgi:Secretion system C-terminal sorting domain
MKKLTLLLLFIAALGTSQTKNGAQFFINELDADQDGTDTLEFIEIKTNPPNTSLDGMIVVLFNGNHAVNGSYNVINLDGFTTDGNGLFIIGDDAVPGVDIAIGASNKIQNGPDAVALYFGVPADFPNGTAPSTTNLLDALVYAKGEPDDMDLLLALGETIQYNEDLNGNSELESLQREAEGTYCTAPITLNNENECEVCTLVITATNSSCDANTSGIDTTTVLIDFEGGGTETFTTTLVTGTGNISGDDPTTTTAGTIIISEVEENTTITVQILSTNCDSNVNTTTPLCETSGDVATIAQLRTGNIGETYTLTGEAILTFQQNLRNQKFIEDTTAAILIDDPQEIITTQYTIGDGISGITGSLNTFNGMLQFTPEIDPGEATSQGNSSIPQAVSIDQLNAAPEDFEAEFVQIVQGVDIDTSINTTWIADQVYAMTNPNGIFNFRAIFFDANYLGLEVPTQNVNIAGIVTERNGNYYLTSRSLNDVQGIIMGAPGITKENFLVFPNPTTEDYIQITSSSTGNIHVEIYDLFGNLLSTTVTNGSVNITSLKSGIYLLKITQSGFETVRKLIVR